MEKSRKGLWIVRMFDYYDGWIDISSPCRKATAEKKLAELTKNGTEHFQYKSNSHYYSMFPADTQMVFRSEIMDP